MEVRLLENKEIDKKAWDQCLFSSIGFELYMQSSFLDIVFPKWKALIAGNYEAIFPVCENSFILWKTLRQPFFTGAWPVIGIKEEPIQKIINYLPAFFQRYHYIDINLMNDIPGLKETYQKNIQKFQQLILPSSGFTPNKSLRKNLTKASKLGIKTIDYIDPIDFIKGVKKHLLSNHNALNSSSLKKLASLLHNCNQFGGGCIGIKNKENSFHAAQFFLAKKNKLHFILCYSTETGRKSSALHALQTKLFDKFLPNGGRLNFGGSNIKRIAKFNHNFQSEDITYTKIIHKKFPFNILHK